MERNLLKRKWYVIFNDLKERWPDLTDSDIQYIYGDKNRLIERVQIRRHISATEAQADVEEFLKTLDVRQEVAYR
jgi:hypothetical protein